MRERWSGVKEFIFVDFLRIFLPVNITRDEMLEIVCLRQRDYCNNSIFTVKIFRRYDKYI